MCVAGGRGRGWEENLSNKRKEHRNLEMFTYITVVQNHTAKFTHASRNRR